MIISSSYEKHEIGSYLDLDSSYSTLNPGESTSEIIVYDGKYYALGVKCSKGYREYKSTQDEYINNIYAFFFSFISDVSDTIINKEDVLKPQKEITFNKDANAVDIATFMIGKQWFGIETKDVVEAISVDDLKSKLTRIIILKERLSIRIKLSWSSILKNSCKKILWMNTKRLSSSNTVHLKPI